MPNTQLGLLRREIDRLNADILDRIQQRAEVVLAIADLKREHGIARRDPAREDAMLLRLSSAPSTGPFDENEVRMIFRAIFEASLALMERQDSSHRCDPSESRSAASGLPAEEVPHAG